MSRTPPRVPSYDLSLDTLGTVCGVCARGSSSHRQQISRKVSQFIPPQGTVAILRYTTLFSVILNANNHSQSAAFIALHARQVCSDEAK